MGWALCGLLLAAMGMVALALSEQKGWRTHADAPLPQTFAPMVPQVVQAGLPIPPDDPHRFVTANEVALRLPMRFSLEAGGVLAAEGNIDPGASSRLAAELEARAAHVKVVSLNSPGGTLDDAMAMARLVRAKGLAVEVADGAICASSCPLLLAGGLTRTVGATAGVGVHQFYAASNAAAPEQAMSDAQLTIARISRHLIAMGVDPALWLHALDTPPQALYYLTPAELAKYRLTTGPGPAAGRIAAAQ